MLPAEQFEPNREPPPGIKFIGIGASTGGPPVLQTILSGLPKDFPVPLLIVQHIARGFLAGHGGVAESDHRLAGAYRRARRHPAARARLRRAR